jgi:hypothetical protein
MPSDSLPYGWCIRRQVATLAGLATWTAVDSVRLILGQPLSQDTGSSEDDGGVFSTTILRYPRFAVHIDDRGFGINAIETSDTALSLPNGARVGMQLVAVQGLFNAPTPTRRIENAPRFRVWMPSVCGADSMPLPSENERVYFYVDSTDRVTKIALTNYGP